MKKQKKELPKVTPVKLQSHWGMKPGVYLTILYGFVLVLLIFLICFLPGIIKGGKRVTFSGTIPMAAVSVNGDYVGGTPVTKYLKSGTYEVAYSLNGMPLETQTVKVGHPVFLTWLFPRKMTVESTAILSTDEQILLLSKTFLNDVAAWSAVTSYDDQYFYPPLFTTFAKQIAPSISQLTPYAKQAISDILTLAFSYITSPEMLNDALESEILLQSASFVASKVASDILACAKQVHGESTQLVGTHGTTTQVVSPVSTYIQTGSTSISGFTYPQATVALGTEVTLSWPHVLEANVQVNIPSFSISATAITESQYGAFIEANPYWAKTNIDRLIADGVVDEYYLAGITPSSLMPSTRPVRNVSWYAANAFCAWLSAATGKDVHLASEAQWTLAARNSTSAYQTTLAGNATGTSPVGLLGGVWELTSHACIPLARISGYYNELIELAKTYGIISDVIVKGGSYVNAPNTITINTVGAQQPQACSDFTGFRIAW